MRLLATRMTDEEIQTVAEHIAAFEGSVRPAS
jgi:hypothetical protein